MLKFLFTAAIIVILLGVVGNIASGSRRKNKREKDEESMSKMKYLKWIGGGLGWAFGGPIGAILGFAFGSIWEGMQSGKYEYRPTQPADYKVSLLVLAAAVMKADEKIMKSELEYVRKFFERQFGQEEANERILMLREIIKQEIKVREVCQQISHFMEYHSRLQLIHFLFGISAADESYNEKEVEMVGIIASYLGITPNDYASIKAMFIKDLDNAYKILEISRYVTNEEVKSAFRKMALKYHPDRVAHLGPDVQKSANEKFQTLLAAYEEIKKQRGMV